MNITLLVCLALALPTAPRPQDDEIVTQAELEAMTKEIQAEVAALRGREFPRSVAVDVANEEEFLDYVMKRMERDSTPADIEAEETVAKLLGVIPPDMDYLATQLALLKEQVGGFYDPDTEGFYLMERFGGDLAKVILAHELTHALDDQLYDLDGTLATMQENADEQLAYHSVIEGSGTSVMNIWTIRNMAKLDQGDLMKAGDMGAEQLEAAPPYLWKPMVGVYLKGAAFLNRTESIMAGQMKLAELEDFETAFTSPPRSSEQILHPDKYWEEDQRDEPVTVRMNAKGELPEGWQLLKQDTFGELMLGLVVEPLAKRKGMGGGLEGQMAMLGTKFTYDASEGWGGDRYGLFGKGDARVLVSYSVWDSPEDAEEFRAELAEVLDSHLLDAVSDTAKARGVEGSGRTVSVVDGGIVYLAWIGTDIETAEALQGALGVEVEDSGR